MAVSSRATPGDVSTARDAVIANTDAARDAINLNTNARANSISLAVDAIDVKLEELPQIERKIIEDALVNGKLYPLLATPRSVDPLASWRRY